MLRDLGVRQHVVFLESYQISTMKHHTGSASLLVASVELSLEPILQGVHYMKTTCRLY
jgi:hypothetical protein